MFYQLDLLGSDQSRQSPNVSLIRMLLFVASWQNQQLLVKKTKNQKKSSVRNGL